VCARGDEWKGAAVGQATEKRKRPSPPARGGQQEASTRQPKNQEPKTNKYYNTENTNASRCFFLFPFRRMYMAHFVPAVVCLPLEFFLSRCIHTCHDLVSIVVLDPILHRLHRVHQQVVQEFAFRPSKLAQYMVHHLARRRCMYEWIG